MTDVHTKRASTGQELDILQIPAFLCRQTDLILATFDTGDGQYKEGAIHEPIGYGTCGSKIRLMQIKDLPGGRGLFGYNNLVVDIRSIPIIKGFKVPVVFDATHSVQLPGGRVIDPVDNRSSCRHWPKHRLQREQMVYLSKPTQDPINLPTMGPT